MKKIVILCICLLLLFGCNKKTNTNNEVENTNTENNVIENETSWNSLKEFPLMDEDVIYITLSYDGFGCEQDNVGDCREIDSYENNKYDFDIQNINIKFTCLKYTEADGEDYDMYCSKDGITIDNKITFEFENDLEYDDKATIILKNNDNYIIKQVNTEYGQGVLNIYDKEGKLLKEYKNAVTEFEILPDSESEEYETNIYNPIINNKKLYFIVMQNANVEDGVENDIDFVTVDLKNNLEYNKLYTTHALVNFGI